MSTQPVSTKDSSQSTISTGGTAAASRATGRALRDAIPFDAHAAWQPAPDRPDPVEQVLASNAGRQERLVPLRMARMAASPFAFLRGAANVMAWDLAKTPSIGHTVMIDGDAHVSNFGLFRTPRQDVVFDLNDFDETLVAPVGVGPEAPHGEHQRRGARKRRRCGRPRQSGTLGVRPRIARRWRNSRK